VLFRSGGTLVGAFGYGWISRRMSRLAISRTALIATFVFYLPIALLPALPIMVLAGFALGLAWGPMQPLMNTVVQRRVPADAQGRVYGIQTSLFYAMPPAFMLATGVAAERVGVMPVLLTLAALMTVVGVSILFVRSFREVND